MNMQVISALLMMLMGAGCFHDKQPLQTAPQVDPKTPAPGFVLAGSWTAENLLGETRLSFAKHPDGKYRANFYTSGCMTERFVETEATYQPGWVKFDKPLKGYARDPFDILHVMILDGRVHLVPPDSVDAAKADPSMAFLTGAFIRMH